MMLVVLLLIPALIVALATSGASLPQLSRRAALLAWGQVVLAALWALPRLWSGQAPASYGVLRFDPLAAWFLLLTLVVVATALTHAVGFFEAELAGPHPPSARTVRQFYGFCALFSASMGLVCCADNLGLLWISIEATTLTSAPLVHYHRSRVSLEATWKYLIICSVGIAFAFFGTAALFAASQQAGPLPDGSLSAATLMQHAGELPSGLLRLGFLFILLGYGTKAGLFPLHTWLPDAHSEAPAPASAMLSGALLNCALLGLWRAASILQAAGQERFVQATLLPLALATVVAASLMLLRQHDLKRLLAYSSMENVGIMATAVALFDGQGLALQALCHSLAKVALFLLAGNLLQDYGSKALAQVRGLAVRRPAEAALLALAVAAVAGTPLFGNFVAEWHILSSAADTRHVLVVVVLSLALAVAFVALAIHLAGLLLGEPPAELPPQEPETRRLLVPAGLVVALLLLGVAMAPALLAASAGVGQ